MGCYELVCDLLNGAIEWLPQPRFEGRDIIQRQKTRKWKKIKLPCLQWQTGIGSRNLLTVPRSTT